MAKMTKVLALVAHDNMKRDLAEWVDWNSRNLSRHHLVCTGTTGKMVEKTLRDHREEDESADGIRELPDLKITMCETTLQALLWLPCIISRFKLQQSVILRQHLHLANSNGVELCQPFRLRYSFINEHGIQIFQV